MLSGGVVADIGCDHGFTSIYLVSRGKAAGAIAMDVREGPLQRAAQHIAEHGLADRIQLRLSDGTDQLVPGEADTILISGMGGALMEQILRARPEITGQVQELILSPQSETGRIRYCLHDMGFRIASEDMVYDMGKFYVVIRAVPGCEHYCQAVEYTYGKTLIKQKHPVFMQFMYREKKRVEKILAQYPDGSDADRRQALQKEWQYICQVLALLER